MRYYNEQRPHMGTSCYRKTPLATFENAKALAKETELDALHRAPGVPDSNQPLTERA